MAALNTGASRPRATVEDVHVNRLVVETVARACPGYIPAAVALAVIVHEFYKTAGCSAAGGVLLEDRAHWALAQAYGIRLCLSKLRRLKRRTRRSRLTWLEELKRLVDVWKVYTEKVAPARFAFPADSSADDDSEGEGEADSSGELDEAELGEEEEVSLLTDCCASAKIPHGHTNPPINRPSSQPTKQPNQPAVQPQIVRLAGS